MATATAERPRTRISTATAAPIEETPETDEDGNAVTVWEVDGKPVTFSLRPFSPEEQKVYWNPQGPDAPMWWRSQELNEWGLQPIIQREIWIDGSFRPRNAWEEYMTIEWLKTVEGGAAGHTWVGYDDPSTPPRLWGCDECGWACGVLACLEQHQRAKRHKGLKRI